MAIKKNVIYSAIGLLMVSLAGCRNTSFPSCFSSDEVCDFLSSSKPVLSRYASLDGDSDYFVLTMQGYTGDTKPKSRLYSTYLYQVASTESRYVGYVKKDAYKTAEKAFLADGGSNAFSNRDAAIVDGKIYAWLGEEAAVEWRLFKTSDTTSIPSSIGDYKAAIILERSDILFERDVSGKKDINKSVPYLSVLSSTIAESGAIEISLLPSYHEGEIVEGEYVSPYLRSLSSTEVLCWNGYFSSPHGFELVSQGATQLLRRPVASYHLDTDGTERRLDYFSSSYDMMHIADYFMGYSSFFKNSLLSTVRDGDTDYGNFPVDGTEALIVEKSSF